MTKYLLTASFMLFGLSSTAQTAPDACSKDLSSHSSKVIKEKVLCLNSGACVQEVYFMQDGFRRSLSNNQKPWVAPDEEIEVLRITTRSSIPGKYHTTSGETYYYKLKRYCQEES